MAEAAGSATPEPEAPAPEPPAESESAPETGDEASPPEGTD